jgi:hypothetical protein
MYKFWLIIRVKKYMKFSVKYIFNMSYTGQNNGECKWFLKRVFTLFHNGAEVFYLETMKQGCARKKTTPLTTFIDFVKESAYKSMVCIVENKLSLRTSLHHYFRISCEICTAIFTIGALVGTKMASYKCTFGVTDNRVYVVLLSNLWVLHLWVR